MRNEGEWDGAVLRELSGEWAERIVFLPECGSTNDEARKLAANIAMRPVKPDLFDTTIPALRAGPKHRFEHIAGLVQRQGMVAVLHM